MYMYICMHMMMTYACIYDDELFFVYIINICFDNGKC